MRRLILLSLILAISAFIIGCAGAPRLRAFDEMIVVGSNAQLRAKMEKGSLGRDVRGAKITFDILHVPESAREEKPVYRRLAEATTDEDGVASVTMKGFFEGVHLIRAAYAGSSDVKAFSQVFAIPKETPIIVCDIDHTIADISAFDFLRTPPEKIPALPGSVETLRELGATFLVVYLTARDDSFLDATVKWLRLKGFPQGPVFFSDLSKSAFLGSAKDFKSMQIRKWREAGFNLAAGIGDRPEDAQTYLANGMKAFVIVDDDEEIPADAVPVKSWAELIDLIDR